MAIGRSVNNVDERKTRKCRAEWMFINLYGGNCAAQRALLELPVWRYSLVKPGMDPRKLADCFDEYESHCLVNVLQTGDTQGYSKKNELR